MIFMIQDSFWSPDFPTPFWPTIPYHTVPYARFQPQMCIDQEILVVDTDILMFRKLKILELNLSYVGRGQMQHTKTSTQPQVMMSTSVEHSQYDSRNDSSLYSIWPSNVVILSAESRMFSRRYDRNAGSVLRWIVVVVFDTSTSSNVVAAALFKYQILSKRVGNDCTWSNVVCRQAYVTPKNPCLALPL